MTCSTFLPSPRRLFFLAVPPCRLSYGLRRKSFRGPNGVRPLFLPLSDRTNLILRREVQRTFVYCLKQDLKSDVTVVLFATPCHDSSPPFRPRLLDRLALSPLRSTPYRPLFPRQTVAVQTLSSCATLQRRSLRRPKTFYSNKLQSPGLLSFFLLTLVFLFYSPSPPRTLCHSHPEIAFRPVVPDASHAEFSLPPSLTRAEPRDTFKRFVSPVLSTEGSGVPPPWVFLFLPARHFVDPSSQATLLLCCAAYEDCNARPAPPPHSRACLHTVLFR